MALTQANLDSVLCNLKNCASAIGAAAVKNTSFGDTDLFCDKIPVLKKLYILQVVLQKYYNALYGTCSTCDCSGGEITDPDILSCPQSCLTDEEVCDLIAKAGIICKSNNKGC